MRLADLPGGACLLPTAGPGAASFTPSPSVESIYIPPPPPSSQSESSPKLLREAYPLDGTPRPIRSSSVCSPLATPIYAARKRKRSHQVSFGYTPTEHAKALSGRSLEPDLSRSPMFNTFDVRYFRDKGLGIITARDIWPGDEIIRERPFITFNQPIEKDDLQRAFDRLSREDKELYLSFTATVPDVTDDLVGIAETNAIDIYNPEDTQGEDDIGFHANVGRSGIFKNICRVNHSCCPTAGWTWHHSTQELALRAYTFIPAGSEVTVAYRTDDIALSRDRRREILLKSFGFTCACNPCSSSSYVGSDANLAEYRSIRNQYLDDPQTFGSNLRFAFRQVKRCLEILETEGKLALIDEMLEFNFTIHAMWGRHDQAKACARDAFARMCLRFGRRRALRLQCAQWRTCPEDYWAWSRCLKADRAQQMAEEQLDDDDSDFQQKTRGSRKVK